MRKRVAGRPDPKKKERGPKRSGRVKDKDAGKAMPLALPAGKDEA